MEKIIILFIFAFFLLLACSESAKTPKTAIKIENAVVKNNSPVVTEWIKNGGDVNQVSESKGSLLYTATGPKGGHEVLKLLVEAGAEINRGAGQFTPLMNAASWGDLKAVQYLLSKGADKTLKNEEGQTAYDQIVNCQGCSHKEELMKLLSLGTAIRYQCESGKIDISLTGDQAEITVAKKGQAPFSFMAQKNGKKSATNYVGEKYTVRTQGTSCLIEKDGELIINNCYELTTYEGLFTYFSDANIFFPCDSNEKIPVDRSGEYVSLQKRYLSLVDGPTKLFIQVKGYVKEGPKKKGSIQTKSLVVTEILTVDKDQSCK